MLLNSSRETKKYSLRFCSGPRGGRVVYEIEKSRLRTILSNLATNVDLPEPDGAETIYTRLIKRSSFQILYLLSRFFDLRLHQQPHLGTLQRLARQARRL